MKRYSLKAEERKITGKKVKQLRREGILPANVYGKDIKSMSLQLPLKDFQTVFEEAGETGLVDLSVGEQKIPVLIHSLQTDFRRTPLHADFFKVNLKEKVKAMIPVEFVGEPKAETEKIGLLERIHEEVEVEALPTELPEKLEISVENLANVDDQVVVSDLKAPEGVEILTDASQVLAKIGELISKEAQELAAEEAAAAEAASAESAEGTEDAAAEGEAGQPEQGDETKGQGETGTSDQQNENKPQE